MGSRNIAEKLLRAIEAGQMPVGSYLPSTRALATQFGVSLNTIHAALRDLEGQKVIECRPRQGAIVRARTSAAAISGRPATQIAVITPLLAPDLDAAASRFGWTLQIIHSAEKVLFEAGLSAAMIQTELTQDGGTDRVCSRLDLIGDALGGVLCFSRAGVVPVLEALDRRNIPWVAINPPGPEMNRNYVAAGNHEGGRLLGRVFAESGFQRVLVLTNDVKRSTSDLEKTSGLFQGYIEAGASTRDIQVASACGLEEMDGYRAMRQVLGDGSPPQAVFATGDLLAGGAMQALRDAGLSVPGDVGVVGATGLRQSAATNPPLAVLRQPMQEMGQAAGRLLCEMISEGIRKWSPRRIPCELILRESLKLPDEVREKIESAKVESGAV